MASLPCHALRARYIFPVARPPLPDAVITLQGERIVAVGENLSGKPPLDLGNVAILPGLVNAHTHLEFSGLETPVGTAGNSLPEWIPHVLRARREAIAGQANPIAIGLRECLQTGTTTVGEIATAPWIETKDSQIDVTVFSELIGLASHQIEDRLAVGRAHLSQPWSVEHRSRPGLSPHASYSVHPELLKGLVQLATAANVPMAMHLAESREELELLQNGSGPFRDLLEKLGVWSSEAIPVGSRVLDYLRVLAKAPRSLVIHGNYLDQEELDFVAAHAARMSVVYCPRTHAYFGHSPYPLAKMLQSGIPVALGTDSRASNPNLNLFEEMQFVARHHPSVEPNKVLELSTLAGARALGVDSDCGSLEPGKLANLAIMPLKSDNAQDPYELLFASPTKISQTCYRGRLVSKTE